MSNAKHFSKFGNAHFYVYSASIHHISQGQQHESLPVCLIRNNVAERYIISVIIFDVPGAGQRWNTDNL